MDDLISNKGHVPGDVLILAQRRVIGNPIHEALQHRGIASKSYYQEGELDNEVAQERLAIFKLFVNRSDRIALRWLLGHGSSDFRKGAYARVRKHCEETGHSPWDAMSKLESGELHIPHCSHLIGRFHAIRNELNFLADFSDTNNFVERWLRSEFSDAAELALLVASVLPEAEDPESLLSKIIEAVTQPEILPDVTEVRIMSLHKSKGLSSPVVIIAGCVDGLLPAEPDQALSEAERATLMEEQRRLFYVGITRVKAAPGSNKPGILMLSGSRMMSLADAMQSGIKPARQNYDQVTVHMSRYLGELGPDAPHPEAG